MFSRGMQGSTYPGLPCTPLRVHQCLQMHKCTLTLTPPNHTCATAFPFSILSLNTLYCGGGGMMIQTMTWRNSGKRRARRNGSGKHNICYHSVYPSECFFYEFDANILREIFSQLSGHKNISRCLNLLLIVRNQEAKKKHTVKGVQVLTNLFCMQRNEYCLDEQRSGHPPTKQCSTTVTHIITITAQIIFNS